MFDMGEIKGRRVFYTRGKSIRDLIVDGDIIGLPHEEGDYYLKRAENCTPIELAAALSIAEMEAMEARRKK